MPSETSPLSSKERHELLQSALGDHYFEYPGDSRVDVRPLIRYSIWSLLAPDTGRIFSSHRARLARGMDLATQVATPLRFHFQTIRDRDLGDLRPVDGQDLDIARSLFISPLSHQHSIGSKHVDRTFSPIGRRLPHQSVQLTIQSLSILARRQIAMGKSKPHHFSRAAHNIAKEIEPSVKKFLTRDQIADRISADFADFCLGRRFGRDISHRLPALERIFTVSWYQPHVMGLLHESNAAGITTIDVQHGQQGPFQSMFVGLPRSVSVQDSIAPAEFWVWGRKTQELMISSQRPPGSIHIAGYPFLLDTDLYRSHLPDKTLLPTSDVLVSLQAPHVDSPQDVPYETIRKLLDMNLSVQLRQHPNHPLPRTAIDGIRKTFSDAVGVIDSNLPFSVLVPSVRVNVSGFSSTTLEAASLGVPSVLWSPIADSQYRDLIASGVVRISQTFEEVESFARNSAHLDFSPVKEYIEVGNEPLMTRIRNLR